MRERVGDPRSHHGRWEVMATWSSAGRVTILREDMLVDGNSRLRGIKNVLSSVW